MEIKEIEAILESVLFAAGEAVPIDKLSEIVDVDKKTLRSIITKMMDYYIYERRGLQIIQLEDCFQMCTRPEYYTYIQKLVEARQQQGFSGAALETLSIVAYNQPVTRSTVEQIRGVNSDKAINRLLERGLIEEVGRLEAPGKPVVFGTTQEFLRCFSLKTLDELPELDGLALEGTQWGVWDENDAK